MFIQLLGGGGIPLKIYIKCLDMKRQCARCGVHIKDETNRIRIWCDRCIQRVNEELEGKADRNYEYYFKFYIKKTKKDERVLGERLKDVLKV